MRAVELGQRTIAHVIYFETFMSKRYWITLKIETDHGKQLFGHRTWFQLGQLGDWFDIMDCFKSWIPQVIGEYEEKKDEAKADKAESRLVTCSNEN